MENNINRMATISEASSIVKLSTYAIRQLCVQERIKYIKSGRKVYVSLPSLLLYCGLKVEGGEQDGK